MIQWEDKDSNEEKRAKDRERHNLWVLPLACVLCVLLVWALDWLL